MESEFIDPATLQECDVLAFADDMSMVSNAIANMQGHWCTHVAVITRPEGICCSHAARMDGVSSIPIQRELDRHPGRKILVYRLKEEFTGAVDRNYHRRICLEQGGIDYAESDIFKEFVHLTIQRIMGNSLKMLATNAKHGLVCSRVVSETVKEASGGMLICPKDHLYPLPMDIVNWPIYECVGMLKTPNKNRSNEGIEWS